MKKLLSILLALVLLGSFCACAKKGTDAVSTTASTAAQTTTARANAPVPTGETVDDFWGDWHMVKDEFHITLTIERKGNDNIHLTLFSEEQINEGKNEVDCKFIFKKGTLTLLKDEYPDEKVTLEFDKSGNLVVSSYGDDPQTLVFSR